MIALTQTVKKGGCAAKVPATVLREILSSLKFPENDENVLVDGRHFDDAGVYRIDDQTSMVQTLDFFTPIVDSPKYFGAIATANAFSDVYAMGAIPKTALAILAFPMTLGNEVVREILQGACDKISEAKANLLGGHSIDDDTLKFGLSVTGLIRNSKTWANQDAKAGDLLILTKPLGTGTLTAGLKRAEYKEEDIMEALVSMARLNNIMDYLSPELLDSINAATDVTGFGLSGHSMQMASASAKTFNIKLDALPVFDLARESIKKGFLTKAHGSNLQYTKEKIEMKGEGEFFNRIIHDPQTSGGLLLSVGEKNAEKMVSVLKEHFPKTAIIGHVSDNKGNDVVFS